MTQPSLPESFSFDQGKLQDYVDCPRRFQLRHVLMRPWPALITGMPTEAERDCQLGEDLHRLAYQLELGLEIDTLSRSIEDPELATWWQTLLSHPPAHLPQSVRRPELVLSAPLAGHRLVAKYDLLAVEPGQRLVIVEWKTAHHRPGRSYLAARLQTRVYRAVAARAGAAVNAGRAPDPEQIEMVYWFARQGGETERFPYDAAQHHADLEYLAHLVDEVVQQPAAEEWPLTPDERHCRFCNYRSLCERHVEPGFPDDAPDDLDGEPVEFEFDLEQIAEIEF